MRLPWNLIWTALYTKPMALVVPTEPQFTLRCDGPAMLAQCPLLRFDRQIRTGRLVDEALPQRSAVVGTRWR